MTETGVFQILLSINNDSRKSISYPKLQIEDINEIAKNLAELVYETLKQKSSMSRIKRDNLLKFINYISEVREPHLLLKIDDILELIKNYFEDEVKIKVSNELPSLEDRVTQFYEQKNSKCREKLKRQKFIKNIDQEKLNLKYKLNTIRKVADFELKESTIYKLFHNQNDDNETTQDIKISDISFRESQIILSYALMNVHSESSRLILKKILQKISSYAKLEEFEANFLRYLWIKEESDNSDIAEILRDNFFFISEGIILKHAINILKFDSETEFQNYLDEIKGSKEILKLKAECLMCLNIKFRLEQVIYELYCFSYCNENILKLCDVINDTNG